MSSNKSLSNFSQAAIQKAVTRKTLEHPVVIYPAVLSVLGGIALALFGTSPLLIGVAAGGFGVAFISWLINFGLRKESFASEYVKALHKGIERQTQEKKKLLSVALKDVNSEQGKRQFQRFSEKFAAFQEILGKKLNPSELTYGRYLGMAEQVFLGGMDNLQDLADTLKAMQVIDIDYLNRRIEELSLNKESAGQMNETSELNSLLQRREIYQNQKDKVSNILAQNEQAMTKMDLTISAISNIRSSDGGATMDLETAMNELQTLANRASKYSIPRH